MSSKRENKKALLKGTAIYAIGNLGTKILAFLIVPLYTYYISTSDMGDYDLLITTVSLLTPLITLRVSDATYRWMLHNIEPEKNCISATYRVILIGTCSATAVLLAINAFIPIKYCYYFIFLLVLGRWMESLQNLLRGLKQQALFAASGILYSLIYLSLNVLLIVVMHQGVDGMFRSSIIGQILTILFILIAEPRLRTRIISSDENRALTKQMLSYSAPLVPSGLSWWVMGASDRYVIRFILGSAANGIYAVANKFPTILSMFFTIFNFSWNDVAIGKLKEGKETSEYTSSLFESLYKIALSFTILLIPATKIVAKLIFSENYKIASNYISYLYLGAVFQGFTTFISAGMLQGTKTGSIAKSSTIGAIVNLAVDLLFMKFIGIQAASISTFLGFFVMWVCRMHDTQSISPISINKKKFVPLLTLAIIVATITIWTNNITDFILSCGALLFFCALNKSYLTKVIHQIRVRKQRV